MVNLSIKPQSLYVSNEMGNFLSFILSQVTHAHAEHHSKVRDLEDVHEIKLRDAVRKARAETEDESKEKVIFCVSVRLYASMFLCGICLLYRSRDASS